MFDDLSYDDSMLKHNVKEKQDPDMPKHNVKDPDMSMLGAESSAQQLLTTFPVTC